MTEDNFFVFVVNEIIDHHSRHAANKTLETHRRRKINFNISQNDENNIDSSFDSLQIRISIKRFLQDIIVTINNQSSKKRRERFKNTKNRSRIDLLSRVDFNVLSYATRNFAFVVLSSRNVRRASKRIAARMKRAIKQKQKIEQSNQKNEIDFIKFFFEKLNDDEFVRMF